MQEYEFIMELKRRFNALNTKENEYSMDSYISCKVNHRNQSIS